YVGDTIDVNADTSRTVASVTDGTHLVMSSNWTAANGTYGGGVLQSAPSRFNIDQATGHTNASVWWSNSFRGQAVMVQGNGTPYTIHNASDATAMVLNTTFTGTTGMYWFTIGGVTSLTFTDTYTDDILNPLAPGPVNTNGKPEVGGNDAWP